MSQLWDKLLHFSKYVSLSVKWVGGGVVIVPVPRGCCDDCEFTHTHTHTGCLKWCLAPAVLHKRLLTRLLLQVALVFLLEELVPPSEALESGYY